MAYDVCMCVSWEDPVFRMSQHWLAVYLCVCVCVCVCVCAGGRSIMKMVQQ